LWKETLAVKGTPTPRKKASSEEKGERDQYRLLVYDLTLWKPGKDIA